MPDYILASLVFAAFIIVVFAIIIRLIPIGIPLDRFPFKKDSLLAYVKSSLGFRFTGYMKQSLKGKIGAVRMVIGRKTRILGVEYIIALKGPAGRDSITISRETAVSTARKKFGIDDVLTGDEEFDGTFLIEAVEPDIPSLLLNRATRKMIFAAHAIASHMRLSNFRSEVIVPNENFRTYEEFTGLLTSLAETVKALGNDYTHRRKALLLENIAGEQVAGVKLRIMKLALSTIPADDDMRAAMSRQLHDTSIPVKIEAARFLGEKGVKYLQDLLKQNTVFEEDDARALVAALGERPDAGSIDALAGFFRRTEIRDIKMSILSAFRSMGDGAAGPFLVELLALEHDLDLRMKIVGALETCGGREAVEPLINVVRGSMSMSLRRAVSDAVRAIQSRLGGAETGWLTMSDRDMREGLLSVSDLPAEGALSADEGEKGNRS